MKVVFQLRFHTRFGQNLFLRFNRKIAGAVGSGTVPMTYKDADTWETVISLRNADLSLTYHYFLRQPDGREIADWGERPIPLKPGTRTVRIVDSWNYTGFYENAFYTEPFQKVLLKSAHARLEAQTTSQQTDGSLYRFSLQAPLLARNQTLCLLGSTPELGSWNTENPILLVRDPQVACYEVEFALRQFPVEYKYGVYDLDLHKFVRFEDGKNRVLHASPPDPDFTMVRDGFAVLPSTTWKGAGVAVPVFSLRSERSFGVGEFADLKLLADWCRAVGLQLIQVLPVNDTAATHTWRDSYPYAAISAFALHPIYLRLEDVAKAPESRKALEDLEEQRRRLNALEALDYESVTSIKAEFMRKVAAWEKNIVFASSDYSRFFDANKEWLVPYAVFCCLRDRYRTSDFNQWPICKTFNEQEWSALAREPDFREGVELAYFTQYHLHQQLENAAAYAHERGIILKGDIPIGVYRYGADAWQWPQLFHLDMQAGAPPDAFAVKGQNWGFPTYNWPQMQRENFRWWKQRFSQMSRYFDAFRIDHILGFFRIWSIPLDAVEGILGFFVPALPVRASEFQARGIPFDRARFVEPYITDAVLREVFGEASEEVLARFFDLDRFGAYSLKSGFQTQREVERALPGNDPLTMRLRQALFDVISNVILLDIDPMGDTFHFRFGMENTSSFRALAPEVRTQLKELYIDYFFRRQDAFWMEQALEKLPALKRVTNMLVCGEDLGLVPACVPQVMRDLGLLSLEIQRMPKDPGREFFHPKDAPYLSVVTPSTHDMSTIRGWWEEDPPRTQRFYNQELGRPGQAPAQCDPDINEAIVLQHLASPAMWSIFMIQDLLGSDASLRRADPSVERINVPAIPQYYWRYRMHLTLERLLQETTFNQRLRQAVGASGRAPVT